MTFPETRHSVVAAVRSGDAQVRERALDDLAAGYWRPVYTYLRLRFGRAPEDAEDLTQEFFAKALDKGWLSAYEPSKGRFRTYLRACLDGFAANEHKAAGRLKRGGGATVFGLDFADAEGDVRERALPASDVDVEELFHREWTRSLLAQAVEDLEAWCRSRGKEVVWEVFRRYDLDSSASGATATGASREAPPARVTYGEVATAVGIPVTQVTNFLYLARRELRRLVIERLRRLCASEAEVEAEARALFGPPAGGAVEPR